MLKSVVYQRAVIAIWALVVFGLIGCGGSGSGGTTTTTTTTNAGGIGGGTGTVTPTDLSPMTLVTQANLSGSIVGDESNGLTANGLYRPANGSTTMLKGLDGTTNTFVAAISAANIVLGSSLTKSGNSVATIWQNGVPAALAQVGDSNDPAATYNGIAINSSGAVAGTRNYLTSGTDAIQEISIGGNPTAGTFFLTVDVNGPQNTDNLAYDATALQIQTGIDDLIGVGSVICKGGPLPSKPVTVEFTGEWGDQPIAQLRASSGLAGGKSPSISITQVQQGAIGSQVIQGLSWASLSAKPKILGPQGFTPTYLTDSGQVVGYVNNFTGTSQNYTIYSLSLNSNAATTLATFTFASTFSQAVNAVENASQTIAYNTLPGSHLYLLSGGKKTTVNANALAYSINTQGDLAGQLNPASAAPAAFVYTKAGLTITLSSLLPKNSGWVLKDARWITDSGLVVGLGNHNGIGTAYVLQLPKGDY